MRVQQWIYLGLVATVLAGQSNACWAQHEIGIMSFSDLPGADYHHPGWQNGEDVLSLDLAHIRHFIFHSGASYSDLIVDSPDGLRFDLEHLKNDLKPENRFTSNLDWRTLGLRWNRGRFRLGFTHEMRFATDYTYTDDLITLLVDGNAGSVGEQVDVSLDGFFHSYNDYALSVGWQMGKLGLSIRPRLLFGQQLLLQDTRKLQLFTDPRYYQLELRTDFDVYSAGSLDFEENNLLNYTFSGLRSWNFTSRHAGMALDVGIAFEEGPFRAGIAVRDLGYISWKDVVRSRSQGEVDYTGVQVLDILDLDLVSISSDLDSLRSLLDVVDQVVDVRQNLRAQGTLALQYSKEDRWQLGMYLLYLDRSRTPWLVSTSYWYRLFSILRLGGTATWRDDRLHLGFMADVQLSKAHLYAAFDHLGAGIRPLQASDYQLSAGLSFRF